MDRPFGAAVVDGFDIDIEAVSANMAPFAARLRALADAAGGRRYYLSATPQWYDLQDISFPLWDEPGTKTSVSASDLSHGPQGIFPMY